MELSRKVKRYRISYHENIHLGCSWGSGCGVQVERLGGRGQQARTHLGAGVNKKPKKIKTVWHGFGGILKLSGRVNQASLKLSAGFSNTVCWTF